MPATWLRAGLTSLAISVTALVGAGTSAGPLLVPNGGTNSVISFPVPAIGSGTALVSSGGGGLSDPRGIAIGPNGNVFVTSSTNNAANGKVLQYSPTGAFINVFATTADSQPFGIVFGPDGNLYVSNINNNSVSRFNGTTGASLGTFVASGSGGLSASRGLEFGPNGNLFVSSPGSDDVLQYNGTTGAFINVFAPNVDARGLAFGPDGNLYVANFTGNDILEFQGSTGAPLGVFTASGLSGPVGLAFDPFGDLYVTNCNGSCNNSGTTAQLLEYNKSGALIATIASNLSTPRLPVFVPEPGTIALLGAGLAGIGFSRRRRAS